MEAPNCDTILVLYKISRFSSGEMTWHCESHRRRHIGNNPAVVRAVAAVGHDHVRAAFFDFFIKFRRFAHLVSAKAKRQQVIALNPELILPARH